MHNIFFAQNIQEVVQLGNGYLYNWYAANDSNFAPTDWRVPSLTDYESLITYLGGNSIAGGKLKDTGLTHWNSTSVDVDNSSGFTAYGAGIRAGLGLFYSILEYGYFWTNTERTIGYNAWRMYLYEANQQANIDYGGLDFGCSIRLLYTGTGTPTTVTDNDGNVYDVVLIGTQYWTIQNWKCTTLENGDPIPNVTSDAVWDALTTLGRCAYSNDESNV